MVQVSAIAPADQDAVASFCAGFEQEARSVDYWRERLRLWWQDNPAFCEDWPRGAKMTDDGRIVGVISAIPTRIQDAGRPVTAASLSTWRVERDHRAASLILLESVLADHERRVVIDSTPTAGVAPILKRYGFQQPMESVSATRFRCSRWHMLKRAWGGTATSLGTQAHLFINEREAAPHEMEGLVDDLWARTSGQFGRSAVRDSAYLRWYCRPGRAPGRFSVVAKDPAGRAAGFAIALDMGGGVAWLVDIWCDFKQRAAVADVVSRSRRHARHLGFHTLWVPHFHPAVATACGGGRTMDLPMNTYLRLPGQPPDVRPSYWPFASGDFGV